LSLLQRENVAKPVTTYGVGEEGFFKRGLTNADCRTTCEANQPHADGPADRCRQGGDGHSRGSPASSRRRSNCGVKCTNTWSKATSRGWRRRARAICSSPRP